MDPYSKNGFEVVFFWTYLFLHFTYEMIFINQCYNIILYLFKLLHLNFGCIRCINLIAQFDNFKPFAIPKFNNSLIIISVDNEF